MADLLELPLKVLWIFNCFEDEQAVDFQLEEGGVYYQVKGSGSGAFDSNGKLKVCLADNIHKITPIYPNRSVLIDNSDILNKIWNYWKYESGELRYNSAYKQWEEHNSRLQRSFFDELEQKSAKTKSKKPGTKVELSQRQVYDMVFELEALVDMQRVFKGSVSKKWTESLLQLVYEGLSEKTISKIAAEAERKGLL